MQQTNNSTTNPAGEVRGHSDQRALPVQLLNIGKLSASTLQRLRSWVETRLEAHNNRVFALGVYRQRRLDGARRDGREE